MTAELLRRSLRTLRERPRAILGLAVIVLVIPQFLEAQLNAHAENVSELGEPHPGLLALGLLAAGIATSFGFVFYAGALDHVVGEHQWGHERPTYRHIARHLPWLRLLAADLLVNLAAALGALLFVVPGIVIYTYLSIVGPIVNIERRGIFASLRRCAMLVHGRFWLAFRLITIPVLFEGFSEDLIHSAFPHDRPVAILLAVVLGVGIAAVVGVIEVTFAHDVVRAHPLPEPVG